MKKAINSILCTFALLLAGCSDYLDINHDPDALAEIPDAKVLLPAAEMGIANNLMGWDMGIASAFWVEYWTQAYTASQFKSLCEYLPNDFNTAYLSLLREPLADLNRIKALSNTDESKAYHFAAEALSIYTWQIITDVWGDMPYSEALRGNEGILHPKQDKGKDIYADLLKRIDVLLGIDITNARMDGKYDLLFAGDTERWMFFAIALKMKLELRLSETSGFDINSLYDYVYANKTPLYYFAATDYYYESGGIRIAGSVWDDSREGKRYPLREFEAGGANYFSTNVRACKSFIDYLRVNGDPRLATLFDGTKGAFFGDFDSKEDSDNNGTPDDKESYANVILSGKMDLFLMSPWEIFFDMAEIAARNGDLTNAELYYGEGVSESLLQHGISSTAIIEPGGYAEWKGGSTEACIKQIAMQRWVANCNYQHIESFLERNRTHYPTVNEIDIKANRKYANDNFPVGELTVSVNGRALLNGNLPASPTYPEGYVFRNNNAPAQKPNIGQKVWWNTRTTK